MANTAGPSSPELCGVPVPAIVVMIPEELTHRTRLLLVSAMNITPRLFPHTLYGLLSAVDVAGTLSP